MIDENNILILIRHHCMIVHDGSFVNSLPDIVKIFNPIYLDLWSLIVDITEAGLFYHF